MANQRHRTMQQRYFYSIAAFAVLAVAPTRLLAAEEPSPLRSPREPADELYERADEIRSKRAPSWSEQQTAVELLVGATGFRSARHGRAFPFNGTLPCRGKAECGKQRQQQEQQDTSGEVVLEGLDPPVSVSASAHRGALRELAKAFQDGWGVAQDMRLALQLFRAASDRGDPEAQGHMGLRYSMGLDQLESWAAEGIMGFGQPKGPEALLHYYFGALGGDMASRMALGYRHLMGLGVPQSCWTAASYYQPVGAQVSDLAAGLDPLMFPPVAAAAAGAGGAAQGAGGGGGGRGSSPSSPSAAAAAAAPSPGGRPQSRSGSLPHVERIRLHLQAAQGGMRSERHRDMVQYYQHSADRGNTEAQTAVGQVLNYGTLGMDRDHAAAMSYFKLAAEAGDADAMAHIGAMYANGYGTAQSYETAQEWWAKAAKRHSGTALFGLGYLHLTGRGGVEQDYEEAFKYFTKAAEPPQSEARPDAWFYLGVMHLKGYGVRRKSVQRALTYFSLAAQASHPLAQYNAAVMHLAGKGTARNCKTAVTLLKTLSEKGPAAASVQLGHEHFFRGRYGLALLSYLRAADLGFEVAQSNAAWMLDRGYVPGANSSELAFTLFKQSAAQSNVHSMLCMGDAYFYGKGVKQDWVRSAAIYYEAYQERSAEAMFNLGFMHEFGVGVPKDLHLAKKFYDMAVHTQPDAFLPVAVANAWLRVHRCWDALRPYLPIWLWSSLFALHPPHTSLFGPWVARLQAALPNLALFHAEVVFWRWVDLTGLGSLGAMVRQGDAGEGATLLALLGGLALVVRLRRRRAAVRLQQQEAAARLLQQQQEQLLVQLERLGVEVEENRDRERERAASHGLAAATVTAVAAAAAAAGDAAIGLNGSSEAVIDSGAADGGVGLADGAGRGEVAGEASRSGSGATEEVVTAAATSGGSLEELSASEAGAPAAEGDAAAAGEIAAKGSIVSE